MKYVKPYKIFEEFDDEYLDAMLNLGMLSNLDRAKALKHKYVKWKITLEFDSHWAAQHDSEEAKKIFTDWLTELANDETQDKIVDPSSIDVDDWEDQDYWQESEENPSELEHNYDMRSFTNFIVYADKKQSEEEIELWADETFGGRLFESVESVELVGEETPSLEKQKNRELQNQVAKEKIKKKMKDIMLDDTLTDSEKQQKLRDLIEKRAKLD